MYFIRQYNQIEVATDKWTDGPGKITITLNIWDDFEGGDFRSGLLGNQ